MPRARRLIRMNRARIEVVGDAGLRRRVPVDPTARRTRPARWCSDESSRFGRHRMGVLPTSATISAWHPRRCKPSCTVKASAASTPATGPPTSTRPAVISGSGPVSWCMSTSRRSPASRPVVAGASTAAAEHPPCGAPRPATGSSTPCFDDCSRLAYSEILTDEQAVTAAGFWRRAHTWFAAHGITDRTSPHRQRVLLPLTAVARRARRHRRDPETHPPLPAPDQRQGRALPPHPPRGMGLHPRLAHRSPCRCQGPAGSARGRPVDLPTGGHQFCPLAASSSARVSSPVASPPCRGWLG